MYSRLETFLSSVSLVIAMGLAQNRRHFDCVALLAKAGVDVNVKNNEEKRAQQCQTIMECHLLLEGNEIGFRKSQRAAYQHNQDRQNL